MVRLARSDPSRRLVAHPLGQDLVEDEAADGRLDRMSSASRRSASSQDRRRVRMPHLGSCSSSRATSVAGQPVDRRSRVSMRAASRTRGAPRGRCLKTGSVPCWRPRRIHRSCSSSRAPCPGSGATIGSPAEGESRFLVESMISRASATAARDSGTWTAIWSPSKSALNAEQTSGWIWIAQPSTSTGSNAWMPRRWSVGARLRSTGRSWITSSRTSQTSGRAALDDALGALDVVREALVDQRAHDERLEQLQRHPLRQAALVQLQLRADDDDRAAGVVDALAEQVLAEAALLALEHVRQALELVVAGAGDGAAAAAVVDQRVDGLLQHALLVADDDLRRAELQQPLEAVVAVDDAAVEVVEVATWRSGRRRAAPSGAGPAA